MLKPPSNVTLLITVLTAAAVAGASAQPVAMDGGLVEGVRDGMVMVFKGIPYAAPPIGELRWRAPQPVAPWQGVRKAATFSPVCPQKGAYPPESPIEQMSEDCLTLNVWTPANPAARLPVMVWIFGGGLRNGSASTPLYSGERLSSRGVVVVTFNYRLGVQGFLAHPSLSAESAHRGSGNYGLLDQVAALNWVQRNIAAFGGDPTRVTIFGQSSGSISISALIASPLTKGLFHRAIGQSGGLFEPVALDPGFALAGAEQEGEGFARRARATSLAELRRLPVETLLAVDFSPHFTVDGFALTKSPYDAYVAGEQQPVDLLVGSNADEGQWFLDSTVVTVANFTDVLTAHFPSLLVWLVGAKPGATNAEARASAAAFEGDVRFRWDMWTWARLAAAGGQRKVFLYQFARTPPFRNGERYHGLGATHGMEMPYVFDHLDQQPVPWAEKDRELASIMPAYWTNFAARGDPNGPGLPPWPAVDRSPRQVMNLGDNVGPGPIPNRARLERIDRVYAAARLVSGHLVAVMTGAATLLALLVAALYLAIRRRRA
ncbi:MAG: carboxylesterase/lipase family protein [Gemmatimonadales bacterium]